MQLKRIVLILITIVFTISIFYIFFSEAILIQYNLVGMRRSLQNVNDLDSGSFVRQGKIVSKYEWYKQKLVELGYFDYKKLVIDETSIPSDKLLVLWDDIRNNLSSDADALMNPNNENNQIEIELWELSQNMPLVLQIIEESLNKGN